MNWSKKAEPVDEKCTFVKKIPDEFICLICSRLLRDPHVTECCGQHYCQHCLEKWLQGNPKKPCPFCRKENCNYIRYLPMKREIDELKVYCLNREKGCEIISTLNKVSDHILKDCEFETVSCFCGTSLLRKDMKDHECPNKIVKCQYCELSGEFKNIMTSTHQTDCPDFPINCPNGCKVSGIKRKTLNQHMQKCPLELVECSYSNVGCHERMYRKDYESHRTENSEKHLQLITESFSQLSTESERLKQENSRLRKENTPYHKLRVENSKLKTEITELKTEVTELKTEITELKKSYRSNSTDRSTNYRGDDDRTHRWGTSTISTLSSLQSRRSSRRSGRGRRRNWSLSQSSALTWHNRYETDRYNQYDSDDGQRYKTSSRDYDDDYDD